MTQVSHHFYTSSDTAVAQKFCETNTLRYLVLWVLCIWFPPPTFIFYCGHRSHKGLVLWEILIIFPFLKYTVYLNTILRVHSQKTTEL